MSPAAKRGPPTSVHSLLNWRFSPAGRRPADEGEVRGSRLALAALVLLRRQPPALRPQRRVRRRLSQPAGVDLPRVDLWHLARDTLHRPYGLPPLSRALRVPRADSAGDLHRARL